jgi:DNA-binding GntR family transcriptional regulator
MPRKDAYVDAYIDGSAFRDASTTPSVAEQLVRKLRVAVLRGDLRPGQKLKEIELCAQFDVSRATLREGFRILESERLFELIPNRGAFVARLGVKQIEEIHDIWSMLTGEAVYRFAERCDARDLRELEKCIARLQEGIEANQSLAQIEATNRFFNYVLLGTQNRMLHEMIIGLVSRLMFLRAQSLLNQGWSLLYAKEIEAIVEAMRNKSSDGARLAAKRHISSVCAAAKQIILVAERKKPARGAAKTAPKPEKTIEISLRPKMPAPKPAPRGARKPASAGRRRTTA